MAVRAAISSITDLIVGFSVAAAALTPEVECASANASSTTNNSNRVLSYSHDSRLMLLAVMDGLDGWLSAVGASVLSPDSKAAAPGAWVLGGQQGRLFAAPGDKLSSPEKRLPERASTDEHAEKKKKWKAPTEISMHVLEKTHSKASTVYQQY
jgi:hypothetical protein